jgi:hypothetical protein
MLQRESSRSGVNIVTGPVRRGNAVTVPGYSCPSSRGHHGYKSGVLEYPEDTPVGNLRLLQRRGSAHGKASLPSGSVKHDIGAQRRLQQQRGSATRTSREPISLHPTTRCNPKALDLGSKYPQAQIRKHSTSDPNTRRPYSRTRQRSRFVLGLVLDSSPVSSPTKIVHPPSDTVRIPGSHDHELLSEKEKK